MDDAQKGLNHLLASYGGEGLRLRSLHGGQPIERFDYADLHTAGTPVVDAVLECDSRPLLYLLRDDHMAISPGTINDKCKLLASRGVAAYLGILEPGRLRVFPCLLEKSLRFQASIQKDDPNASSLLTDLSQGIVPKRLAGAHRQLSHAHLRKKMLEVFKDAGKRIRESPALAAMPKESQTRLTLALVGRVLFVRFLLDRDLVPRDLVPDIDYTQWFSTPNAASYLCTWLDKTFNGELLPLLDADAPERLGEGVASRYQLFFASLFQDDSRLAQTLYNLFLGSPDDDQYKLLELLNFAHIPVGLLSEVYEDFAHKSDPENAKATSVHYTPHHIVETMVNQAFDGLPEERRHSACVLDPAAGAGVFLVATFRRLARERVWANLPVDTGSLRTLLYTQLCGLDINPNALSLASLALYLTAIELDPEPEPVTKLRFEERLLGKTLHHIPVGVDGLGSLGAGVSATFDGRFDIVLGNPPWTSGNVKTPLRAATRSTMKRILEKKLGEAETPASAIPVLTEMCALNEKNCLELTPDFVPDIPFVIRSIEWAKPQGIISFALHGRLLFKRTSKGVEARNALFSTLRVTGVINGADLRGVSNIWPDVTAPFCIIFAVNETPCQHDGFRFLNPFREGISRQGRLRVASSDAYIVSMEELTAQATLLKTLFRGTPVDLGVVSKIEIAGGREVVRLGDYWKNDLKLTIGEGYIRGNSGRVAPWLHNVKAKVLDEALSWSKFTINEEELSDFDLARDTMHRPRSEERYKPPLLLVWKSFSGKVGKDVSVYNGESHLIYPERYLGLSAYGYENCDLLLAYVFLLFHSRLARYYFLMTSSGYGVERESLNLDDIYSMPLIPLHALTSTEVDHVRSLSTYAFDSNIGEDNFRKMADDFVCGLYGLNTHDIDAMKDSVSLFQHRSTAEAPPSEFEIESFATRISADIAALYELYGAKQSAHVTRLSSPLNSWYFLEVRKTGVPQITWENACLQFFTHCADHEGVSEIVLSLAPGRLIIGRLSQRRFWTKTQARLCGQDVVVHLGEHSDVWGLTDPHIGSAV